LLSSLSSEAAPNSGMASLALAHDDTTTKRDLCIIVDVSGSMSQGANGGANIFVGSVMNTFIWSWRALFTWNWSEYKESWERTYQTKLCECKRAIREQIQAQRDTFNKVSLIAFNSGIAKYVRLTEDIDSVLREIDRLEAGGQTALYDAVAQAYDDMSKNGTSDVPCQLLVLTDGMDNRSTKANYDKVRGIAQHNEELTGNQLQAFLIGIGEGDNKWNERFAKDTMRGQYGAVDKKGWFSIKESGAEAEIKKAFDHFDEERKRFVPPFTVIEIPGDWPVLDVQRRLDGDIQTLPRNQAAGWHYCPRSALDAIRSGKEGLKKSHGFRADGVHFSTQSPTYHLNTHIQSNMTWSDSYDTFSAQQLKDNFGTDITEARRAGTECVLLIKYFQEQAQVTSEENRPNARYIRMHEHEDFFAYENIVKGYVLKP